jgi:hypothetical protein
MKNHAQIRVSELRIRAEAVSEISNYAKAAYEKYDAQKDAQRKEGVGSAITALAALMLKWDREIRKLNPDEPGLPGEYFRTGNGH